MYEIADLIVKIIAVMALFRLSKTIRGAFDVPLDNSQPYDYTQHDREVRRSHLYEANKDQRLPDG